MHVIVHNDVSWIWFSVKHKQTKSDVYGNQDASRHVKTQGTDNNVGKINVDYTEPTETPVNGYAKPHSQEPSLS